MQGADDAKLLQTSNEFIATMKEFQTSNKWQLDEKPVLVHKMEIDDRVVIRAETKIGLPIETIGQFFSNPLWMKIMTEDLKKCEIIYDNKTIRVVNSIIKLPGPISNR